MIRGKTYHTMTDSHSREKEPWFADIPNHIDAFLRAGGKVYQASPGESFYNKHYEQHTHAFKINPQKESKLGEKK